MGKHTITKRLSSTSQPISTQRQGADVKARGRIEHLYELTDEIINAYNEINEKYVNQIYRKYKHIQEINKKLKEKLTHHHCSGCKCSVESNDDEVEQENEDDESDTSHEDDNDEQIQASALPSSTTNSSITRKKQKNPFIIPDIEDTQNFDENDNRFDHKMSDDDDDDDDGNTNSMDTRTNNKSEEEEEEDDDEELDENNDNEDNGMDRLPIALQRVIKNKARRNKNAKLYLLQIPRFPALCEFLRDKSASSFYHRPTHDQVRPLIEKYISRHLATDTKMRIRLRDELREIHRSYMRTFMNDPRSGTKKNRQTNVKKSPM